MNINNCKYISALRKTSMSNFSKYALYFSGLSDFVRDKSSSKCKTINFILIFKMAMQIVMRDEVQSTEFVKKFMSDMKL